MSFDMNVEAGKVKKTFTVAGREAEKQSKKNSKKEKRGGKEETGKLFTDHNTAHSHPRHPTTTDTQTHTLKKKIKKELTSFERKAALSDL